MPAFRTNISRRDFAYLKNVLSDWTLFDEEYTSFDTGLRKPELGYYNHVLGSLGLTDPRSAIFVDDKVVNVSAAQSLGIQGTVFESADTMIRNLRNRLFDPVMRARQYMVANAGNLHSQIENGPAVRDVFSQFLIHKELQNPSIISLSPATATCTEVSAEIERAAKEARAWNYFIGPPAGTTLAFPEDVDDTAYALLSFSPPAASANPILDRFLAHRHHRDGLVQIYFDDSRPRVCPVVLVNVVRVFYHYGRGADVQNELKHVRNILLNRAYVNGTAHYLLAEPFLYFLASLVEANPGKTEIQSLCPPLVTRLRERVGRQDDSFAVAARVLACQAMGVWVDSDVTYLKELQEVDGGWEIGWVCCYGRSKKRIGSRGVVTAFATKALEQERRGTPLDCCQLTTP
jgi:hypothetical protein